jgi:hypothetical protein
MFDTSNYSRCLFRGTNRSSRVVADSAVCRTDSKENEMRRFLCVLAVAALAAPAWAQRGPGPDRSPGRGDRGPEAGPIEEVRRLQADLRRLEERLRELDARISRTSSGRDRQPNSPGMGGITRGGGPGFPGFGGSGFPGGGGIGPQGPRGFGAGSGQPGGFSFAPQGMGGFGALANPPSSRGGSSGGESRRTSASSSNWERRLDRIQQELDNLRREMRDRR